MEEMKPSLALVTGAARRIGRELAITLAHLGYAILLHYNHSEKEAAVTEKEIKEIGVPVYPVQADLTKTGDIDSLFSYLDSLDHQLRILVNSAAVMQRADIQTLSVEDWDATMALNLRAPFLISRQAAERMKDGGLIVNITDAGAGKAWTGFMPYSVSKKGLETLTHVLAKSLAPKIRVNAIAPGLVLPSENISDAEWHKLVSRLPLKRPTAPDEICSALVYLMHNDSVTGQTIVLDSGYSLI